MKVIYLWYFHLVKGFDNLCYIRFSFGFVNIYFYFVSVGNLQLGYCILVKCLLLLLVDGLGNLNFTKVLQIERIYYSLLVFKIVRVIFYDFLMHLNIGFKFSIQIICLVSFPFSYLINTQRNRSNNLLLQRNLSVIYFILGNSTTFIATFALLPSLCIFFPLFKN